MKTFTDFKKILIEQPDEFDGEEGDMVTALELIKLMRRFISQFQRTESSYPLLGTENGLYVFVDDDPKKIKVLELQRKPNFEVRDRYYFSNPAVVSKMRDELKKVQVKPEEETPLKKEPIENMQDQPAYKKGYADFDKGHDKEDSPYDPNSTNTQLWISGWEQAQKDLS
jgi:ribosome modulation factor